MRSTFAAGRRSATADSLRSVACQPKLAVFASEGWTTEKFVEAVYNDLKQSR
ncbi:MAG TPA: hypothetical protein VMS40_16110 [Vicinamibacterales bacterium]|nr:hypothetical protein [Vicinamibacterales bacterium]